MQFARALDELKHAYEQLENEVRDLRRINTRLAHENSSMCDDVFELQQQLAKMREAKNE